MYNLNYVYLTITIEKTDMAYEDLYLDLISWTSHLYPVEHKTFTEFKGLVPQSEMDDFETLMAASPYGNGYEVAVDGIQYRDYGLYPWRHARGLV